MLRSTLPVLLAFACAALPAACLPTAALGHPSDSVADKDNDGVLDPPFGNDNCAGDDGAVNPTQADVDGDGRGDACDTDDDGDTIDDVIDNCPLSFNQNQSDIDGDAIGDLCDSDDDGDGRADSRDNCRFVANPGQSDADRDGLGDACDTGAPGSVRPSDAPPVGGVGPSDTTPPAVKVALRGRHRTAELGAGLAVPITCSEGCTVGSKLTVSPRDARRLKLRGRTLGSGGAELDGAGDTFVFVEVPRATLARVRGRVRAVLTIDIADAAGNRRTMTRRLTIRS
jgi:Thrombospondin type 3 repeat